MFRSILVPLDGSEFAEEAIPLALSIALALARALELLRVHELYALHDTHACLVALQTGRGRRSSGTKSRHTWMQP